MTAFSIEPNERVAFRVRHEDPHLVVVEKPAHLVTQPGIKHERTSLLNGLFARFGPRLQQLGKARDFGMVHRLDKETSGLVVVALSALAYDELRAQFANRKVSKFYWAVTMHPPKVASGIIRKPIAESESGPIKTARISRTGKPAITAFRVLQAGPATLVECRPVTGRLHQVRVHLESIGCPILGDDLYAPEGAARAAPRLALHAHRIAFTHPVTGVRVDVRSPWPKDLRNMLTRFGLTPPALGGVDGPGEVESHPVDEHEPGVGEDQPPV